MSEATPDALDGVVVPLAVLRGDDVSFDEGTVRCPWPTLIPESGEWQSPGRDWSVSLLTPNRMEQA